MTAVGGGLWCAAVEDTEALGERLGRELEPGDVLSLQGPLGAGKTTLVRGLARGVGADPSVVKSPTFVLHHVYPGGRLPLHHLDLYRLGPGAVTDLLDIDGLLEGGAVAVEWGELAPLDRFAPIRIGADIDAPNGRRFTLLGDAPPRIRALWEPPA